MNLQCPECGSEVFQLATVIAEVAWDNTEKTLSFDAPDATSNINALCCNECGREGIDDFGGTWKVKAKAVGAGLIEGEMVG